MVQLLRDAAVALDNGEDPFHAGWLSGHEVTFDECMTLSTLLAGGARVMAEALADPAAAAVGATRAPVWQALEKAFNQIP